MKKITLITPAPVSQSPRLLKVADALREAGVELI
jgi:hypothetical protein